MIVFVLRKIQNDWMKNAWIMHLQFKCFLLGLISILQIVLYLYLESGRPRGRLKNLE